MTTIIPVDATRTGTIVFTSPEPIIGDDETEHSFYRSQFCDEDSRSKIEWPNGISEELREVIELLLWGKKGVSCFNIKGGTVRLVLAHNVPNAVVLEQVYTHCSESGFDLDFQEKDKVAA